MDATNEAVSFFRKQKLAFLHEAAHRSGIGAVTFDEKLLDEERGVNQASNGVGIDLSCDSQRKHWTRTSYQLQMKVSLFASGHQFGFGCGKRMPALKTGGLCKTCRQ